MYQREVWCVSGCWGLQDLKSRSTCVPRVHVRAWIYAKSVVMSQYLFQGDESGVGMSEGVTSWMLY